MVSWAIQPENSEFSLSCVIPFSFFIPQPFVTGYWKSKDTGLTGHVANLVQLFLKMLEVQWCQSPQSGTALWAHCQQVTRSSSRVSTELIQSLSKGGKDGLRAASAAGFASQESRSGVPCDQSVLQRPLLNKSSAFSCFSACSVWNHLQRRNCTCYSSILSPGMGVLAVGMFSGGFHLFLIPWLWC